MESLLQGCCRGISFTTNYFKLARLFKSLSFLFFLSVVCTSVHAQTVQQSNFNCTPSQAHCTSNDLQIVRVFTDAPPCATCNSGSNVTYTLKMTIHNGTKSTRTAFVLYGTLSNGASITPIGGGTAVTGKVFICVGPVTVKSSDLLPGETAAGNQTFTVGTISFSCGQSLTLTDNILAWTDASGTTSDRCGTFAAATQCSDVEPKCGEAGSITIQQPLSAPSSATQSCSNVSNGSVTVTPAGGTSPYNITIDGTTSTGVLTATKSSLGAGTYNFSVTDANGCSVSGTQAVTNKATTPPPGVSVVNNCDGSSDLTATGFTGTLLWSTGATTTSIHVTAAGTYTVTQTVNGCTSSPGSGVAAPKTSPAAPGVSVVNNCDGSSDLTATGFTGTLSWSTGATTTSIHVTVAGTYTVTQTVNGCTSPSGSGIAAPKANPAAPGVSVVNNCDGSSDLTATGFTGTLQWSTGASTTSIHVTAPGTYTVTQTVNGCTSGDGSGVAAPKNKPSSPGVSVVNNCGGSSDLTATGFTGTLLWSTGATTSSIHVTTPGTYTVTQTVNGCTSDPGSGIAAPKTTPSFTVCIVQPTLCSTGSLTINASGGSGFHYSIDGTDFSNTTGVFTNLGAASVTSVQVKNGDNCPSSSIDCAHLTSTCGGSITKSSATKETFAAEPTVKAYPNPFSDKINFVVTTTVSGKGSLDVYNMMGQKVRTIYQGFISAGTQTFQMNSQRQQVANLIYVLRIGDKKITGRILQINQ